MIIKKEKVFVFVIIINIIIIINSTIISSVDQIDNDSYELLNEMFESHMNYFLSDDAVTIYGLPLTAYKVGDRARFGYSNPTEWGYLLQSYIASEQREIITEAEAVGKIDRTLNILINLQSNPNQNYNNLFYPYYKVTNSVGNDIFPYHDSNTQIPSIDNGLLYMSLLITEGWAKEIGNIEIENKAKSIKDKMDFRIFLFNEGDKLYIAHLINANNGQISTSKWDVYSDEGGLMSLIAYFSDSISFNEYKKLTNSQMRNSASWNGHTVKEAAWFNSMFTWSVRSLAGFKVIGTNYSQDSFAPSIKAFLDYGDFINIDYPGFSDAMTQVGGVGRYTPPNLANQVPTSDPSFITPHAFFVGLNIIPDLEDEVLNELIEKINLLKEDSANYYHDSGNYNFGFEVIASPYKNDVGFRGAADGRYNFETLSEAYIVLSLFNGLSNNDNKKDFYDLAKNVDGYSEKVEETLIFLYEEPFGLNCIDLDNDGFNIDGGECGQIDCNDNNNHINPDVLEICDDGIDNNCNGLIDIVDSECGGDSVITVCKSGECDFTTIQGAVDSSVKTDIIYITDKEVYEEEVVFGGSRRSNIIDCNGATLKGNGTVSSKGILMNRRGINTTIKNCIIMDYYYGTYQWDGKKQFFINNTFINNTYGLYFDNSDSQNIIGNKFYNNDRGIHFYYSSNNHYVENNLFENNDYGISYSCHHSDSSGSRFVKNTAINNEVGFFDCNSNNVYNDNIAKNNNIGFYLGTYYSNFSNNIIKNNGQGFNIYRGDGNIFSNNKLIDNTQQVLSDEVNLWDLNGLGNYWSDYDEKSEGCIDSDENGICDDPYLFDDENQDNFPLIYNNWCNGADMDEDGKVWLSDWAVLRNNFGNTAGRCGILNNWCNGADMDEDGKVWLSDWAVLRSNFGKKNCRGFVS